MRAIAQRGNTVLMAEDTEPGSYGQIVNVVTSEWSPPMLIESILATGYWQEPTVTAAGFDESRHPRDPGGEGGGRWIPKGTTAEGRSSRIGATNYRPEDKAEGFYDSPKGKAFEASLAETAAKYGVTVDDVRRAWGYWEGSGEPSWSIMAHDGPDGVAKFAEDLRAAGNQDGVIHFDYDDAGPDSLYYVGHGKDIEVVEAALKQAGISGAAIGTEGNVRTVEIIGSPDDEAKVAQLAEALDAAYVDVYAGNMKLAERPES